MQLKRTAHKRSAWVQKSHSQHPKITSWVHVTGTWYIHKGKEYPGRAFPFKLSSVRNDYTRPSRGRKRKKWDSQQHKFHSSTVTESFAAWVRAVEFYLQYFLRWHIYTTEAGDLLVRVVQWAKSVIKRGKVLLITQPDPHACARPL